MTDAISLAVIRGDGGFSAMYWKSWMSQKSAREIGRK
jgi:hypothetical protein